MADIEKQRKLEKMAYELRMTALTMIYEAQSGHPGGAFSAADLITALYFDELNVDPANPKWEMRDRFILSKGHVCPILYAALSRKGYFPEAVLHTLRQEGSILQGHPDMKKCPGIDISSGSLGQGLSVAVGMAIAGKRDQAPYRVFAMIGDGELDEGQIWEAIMTANKYHLDNLCVILDHNGLQVDGTNDQVMPHLDVCEKLRAFGYDVYDIDGHDMGQILDTFEAIRRSEGGKPVFINARTVKGKGVSFMEGVPVWHGQAPNTQQYEEAMKELAVKGGIGA
ncbi:MAG: transketolase [Clostridia bacterium]|nr:transketolase [Clostridia bacterium]